jgi:hypothetical protein
MKALLVLIFLISTSFADSKGDAKKVSHAFIKSIFDRDLDAYKKSVSKSFFATKTKNVFIKNTFNNPKKKKKKIGEYDLELKKGAVDNLFFVNFKEKSQATYSDNWFVLKLNKEDKFEVDGVHHFED